MPTQQNIAPDDAITAIRFPIRLLTLVCLLTIVAFAWFSWAIFEARRDDKTVTDQLSRIEKLRGVIVHLEEVLTMSARMAAATGESRWEERYRHFEPQLDAAIKETTKIETNPSNIKTATKTDEANIKLVEMENRAFALVRAGRKEEAQAVLFSPEYENQKQIYAEGIASFTNQIRHEFDESLRNDRRIDLLSIIAAMVVGGTSFVAWFSAARGVRGWRAQLLDSFQQRAEAEENLRKAHAKLEVRVKERTAELANTNEALQAEITERKSTEEQLLVQTTALDAAANAIIITDHNGTIKSVNPAFTALTGYTAQEAVGQNTRLLKSGNHDEAFYRNLWQTISSGRVWSGELTNRRKDGSLYTEEQTIAPVAGKGGRITHYIAIKQDVTERRQAERSLRLFRSLIEQSNDAIEVVDPETGRFLDANEKACTDLGYTREEFLSLKVPDIDPVFDQSAFSKAVEELRKSGAATTESLYRRKDGSRFPVEINLKYVQLDRDYMVTVVRDITERKQTEERLIEQADIINRAQDAIIIRDFEDEDITFWNKGAEQLYGWSAKEAVGKPIGELIFANAEDREGPLKVLVSTGEFHGETKQVTKDGREIIVDSRASLILKPDGRPHAVLLINTDVTEQKKLETQLLRAQRLESIGTLASGVAHDLNNILVPIMMAAPVLRGKMDPAEREKFIDIVESSAHRGADIIKQVLTFARGADGDRILLQPIYLLEEVSKIAGRTFPKSIVLRTYYEENIRLLEADSTQLHQVLLNLCINARDAMPNGGDLCLGAENFDVDRQYASKIPSVTAGPYVMLQVTDTGSGIPNDVIAKIFDPFFTTKRIGQGTGLGLSTVAGIVKSHGGFISVSSKPGHTSFKVFLPAKATLDTSSVLQADTRVPRGNGQTILLVDDEPSIREIAEIILKSHGYKVLVAENGPTALALFARQTGLIAVVVTDLAMPDMDGLVFVRILRQMQPGIKVIVSTGRADDSHAAELVALNVAGYLTKPYTTRNLLLKLSHVLHSGERISQPRRGIKPGDAMARQSADAGEIAAR